MALLLTRCSLALQAKAEQKKARQNGTDGAVARDLLFLKDGHTVDGAHDSA